MNDDREKQEALEAIRKVASIKAKPYVDKLKEKAEKKAKLSLSDLGIEPEYLKYAAGAAKLADSLQKQALGPALWIEGFCVGLRRPASPATHSSWLV